MSERHERGGDGGLRVAIAQRGPAYLDRAGTIARVVESIERASEIGAGLVAFGEAFVPGYPFWLERVDAARFESAEVKRLQAMYLDQGVRLERGDLDPVCESAGRGGIAVVLGIMERAHDRGGMSLYCSCVFIDRSGRIGSVHRKLMPTYEERLSWAIGDGHGLRAHEVGGFVVGALNCWENWMPLARASLHAQGETLHVGLWPGAARNTSDITRYAAVEGRMYVVSACATGWARDVPADVPMRERIVAGGELIKDGGSCVAGPDGSWVVEPVAGRDELILADLDPAWVLAERTTFDPAGHYARPDVLGLRVDRRRQRAAEFVDEP